MTNIIKVLLHEVVNKFLPEMTEILLPGIVDNIVTWNNKIVLLVSVMYLD